MLKKTIKYTDFDGTERTEDFYFGISKTELTKAQLSVNGGLTAKLEKLVNGKEMVEIAQIFSDFIDMSYGEKSDDGKRFVKNQQILDNFKSTAAYDELFMEIISDTKKAADFINGILPADISSKLKDSDEYKKIAEQIG